MLSSVQRQWRPCMFIYTFHKQQTSCKTSSLCCGVEAVEWVRPPECTTACLQATNVISPINKKQQLHAAYLPFPKIPPWKMTLTPRPAEENTTTSGPDVMEILGLQSVALLSGSWEGRFASIHLFSSAENICSLGPWRTRVSNSTLTMSNGGTRP